MDPMDAIEDEKLLAFFRRKKTEMSCMGKPLIFLSQLRDHDLVSERVYKNVIRLRAKNRKVKGVYDILDSLEAKPECMKTFWKCVFMDHILQEYPALRVIRNSLMDVKEDVQPEGKTKPKKRETIENIEENEEEDEQPGPSSQATTPQRQRAKKPAQFSPLLKGQQRDIWNWPLYKSQLPVNCGGKEGTLHREKLSKGEKCIFFQGRWFSPPEFQQFGGKKSNKNWKISIRCKNKTLQALIKEGHLKAPCLKGRLRSGQTRRALFPSSEYDSQTDESDDDSGDEEEEVIRGEEEEVIRGEEEDQCTGEGQTDAERPGTSIDEDVDLSIFEGEHLIVQCGSIRGSCHKVRFASGSKGKCIRTEKCWLTPTEFVQQETNITDANWRKDIICNSWPLSFLIAKKVLRVHSVLCECRLCSSNEQDQLEQRNDDWCFICGEYGDLVCCDKCPRSFHRPCHIPPPPRSGDKWLCTLCVWENCQAWRYDDQITEQQALDRPITTYMTECQALLMKLLSEDKQRIFTSDPSTTVECYTECIKKPMWLERVKLNLQSGDYKFVREFVSDVRLIFDNCATFNKNNEFGSSDEFGAQLRKMFEEEFCHTFKTQSSSP
ncbi:sp110 nuclear body protein-like isoform X2 [Denticeps clupeoides]|uniref:sp110 nuclear body protein-like isoform X2 n=1 Tax=Denticeps clupeoides TaxID=299321 RepID=UPI0010A3C0C6|nr:sp110 nuclear body protein-like isoform X2 [Denticeps clupeoides]